MDHECGHKLWRLLCRLRGGHDLWPFASASHYYKCRVCGIRAKRPSASREHLQTIPPPIALVPQPRSRRARAMAQGNPGCVYAGLGTRS